MRHLKRLTVIMLVMAMILSTAGIAAASLSDIVGEPCEEAAGYLYDLGVLAGYPDGTFKPDRTITRAEAVKIIVWLKYGSGTLADLLKGATPFSDVAGSHWASGYIALGKNAGILHGYPDGTFKPEAMVTYAEFAKMLVEAAGLAPVAGLEWPANYVAAAQAAGILGSVPGFAANSPATRGDCAIMAAFTVQEVKDPATGKTLAQSVFGQSAVATITVTPATASVGIGGTQQFTAVALDSSDEAVTGEVVTWTATGGTITPTGLFTGTTGGPGTVTATIGSVSGTASVAVFGAATALRFEPIGTIVANGKTSTVATVSVVDAGGNIVPTATGTVNFMSSNVGSVTVSSASATLANGQATVTLKSGGVGATTSSVISASAAGLVGAAAVVTPVAQTLTTISVTADPTGLAADGTSQSTISVVCKDQAGETMTVSGLNVRLTSSNTAVGSFGGSATTTWTGTGLYLTATTNVGTATISGEVTAPAANVGMAVTSATVSTAIVGSPYKLSIDSISDATALTTGATGTTQKVVVRVLDVNGNQVTTPTVTSVSLAANKAGATITGGTVTNGKATFEVTYTNAEAVNYTATGTFTSAGGSVITLLSATGTGTFVAGPANKITLTGSPVDIAGAVRLNADGVSAGTITAKITDSEGNAVTTQAVEVPLTQLSSSATKTFAASKQTTVSGAASWTVFAKTVEGTDQFKATATGYADVKSTSSSLLPVRRVGCTSARSPLSRPA